MSEDENVLTGLSDSPPLATIVAQLIENLATQAGLELIQELRRQLETFSPEDYAIDKPGIPFDMPSRRHPPREDVVTFRVRVDLEGAKPPISRRLELASNVRLDVLHVILQIAFEWQNGHLHEFMLGDSRYDRMAERFGNEMMEDDLLGDSEPNVSEKDVRLDEVLAREGDKLFYIYDFGDNWEHKIVLESIQPRKKDAPVALCTGGKRAAPPDDCGGVWGYEWMIDVARDPNDPDHDEAAEQYEYHYPNQDFDPAVFDRAGINAGLRSAWEGGFSFTSLHLGI